MAAVEREWRGYKITQNTPSGRLGRPEGHNAGLPRTSRTHMWSWDLASDGVSVPPSYHLQCMRGVPVCNGSVGVWLIKEGTFPHNVCNR